MIFIGIDPGLFGAVGVVNTATPGIVKSIDTPIFKTTKGPNQFDLQGMVSILMQEAQADCHALIENVNAFPGQGMSSGFNFGKGCGMWIGMLAALQIPYSSVSPGKWKKAMGLNSDKNLARLMAQQLFPKSASLFARKKDDGRAEAVLMAEWGRRTINPKDPLPKREASTMDFSLDPDPWDDSERGEREEVAF